MCTDRINEYMEKIALDAPVSPEYLASAVAGAIKDRALLFYFTWKTLQDMHPEIDADAVMAEASRRLGEYKAPNLGKVEDAEDAVLNQTSKAGMLQGGADKALHQAAYAPRLRASGPLREGPP